MPLPPRQRQILDLIVEGRTNKQIARRLGIAEGTVKAHIRLIFDHVGVENRTQAAVMAVREGA